MLNMKLKSLERLDHNLTLLKFPACDFLRFRRYAILNIYVLSKFAAIYICARLFHLLCYLLRGHRRFKNQYLVSRSSKWLYWNFLLPTFKIEYLSQNKVFVPKFLKRNWRISVWYRKKYSAKCWLSMMNFCDQSMKLIHI